jgi:hypothetical protein
MRLSSILGVLILLLVPLAAWAPNVIPEPSSTVLFAVGVAAVGAVQWWSRRKK